MAETIKVLVSEEEVNERIKTLGKQISENYAGKQIHMICVLKGGVFSCVNWLKESVCRFLWTLCV